VAFVTSPTGAAIRDFLAVLERRWRGIEVLVIPSRVQGDGAAHEIAAGIAAANRLRRPIDVLVVGRGGGSLEDLWAFNEEVVIRAIAASRIPVISAVGHEIDVTLSDLVADVRALTPSEAAERLAPAADDLKALLRGYGERMTSALRGLLHTARGRLDALAANRTLRRPLDRIHDQQRRLDELAQRAGRSMRHRAHVARALIDRLAGKLDSLSPLGVLGRGYSVTQRLATGGLVTNAAQLATGELLLTRLAQGQVVSKVERTIADTREENARD
jgi:exodeoxyribonuclease VII large subunit